jgi:phosphatidylinositol alpha 1,6-mannosyltransferase
VRIALITESFLPHVDGVSNAACRTLEHLRLRGHEALLVAPGAGPASYAGTPVLSAPSFPMPGYPQFRAATPWPRLTGVLRGFAPDVVHLAAPAGLGAQAAWSARRLGVPSVAVYHTDLAGFAARYGLGAAEGSVRRWLARVHRLADRTLAPSWDAVDTLLRCGVSQVMRWVRGVDLDRFHPRHRDPALRARLAPGGELLVGYVGRLAREKRLELLAGLTGAGGPPNVRLVLVGDGPMRARLEHDLPGAAFLGFRSGAALSAAVASLDVFVHAGTDETFCQAAQEAKASGVPVVAPAAGGLLDLVEDGRTGLLYPPGSAAGMRERVGALAADAPARRAMGLAARASVRGRSWPDVGDELIGHYRDVVGARERRSRR